MNEQEATLDEFVSETVEETDDQHLPEVGEIPDDWNLVTVEDVSDNLLGGGTPSKSEEGYWGGDIPWASVKDLNGIELSETEDYITESGVENSATNVAPANSIIISTRMTVGEPFLNKVDMAINQDMKAIIPNTKQANPLFLVYSLWDKDPYLKSLGRGTTVDGITTKDLLLTHLGLPSLEEQRKIASVLYTVDQAIQLQDDLVDQTKQVKNGLMKTLFTEGYFDHDSYKQNGWRCKAKQIPEEWDIAPADDLMTIRRGASPRPRSDDTLFGGDIPWIKIGDADREGSQSIDSVESYVTEKGKSKSEFVTEGTLLVANSGATCGFAVFAGLDGCVHDGWLILEDYEEFDKKYLYHYINWNYEYLRSLSLGSAQTNLSTYLFGRLDIPKPPIEEQREIADSLDSLEKQQSQYRTEKKQLKRLKKGLMHDLLSGEVRTHDKDIELVDDVLQHG